MTLNKIKIPSLNGIQALYDAHIDYKKELLNHKETKEIEITKRHLSDNRTQEYLAEVKLKRDVILKALENDYQLKESKIQQSFKVIDAALDTGNIEMLGLGLTAMIKVAETSTISNIMELSKKLENKNNIIDI